MINLKNIKGISLIEVLANIVITTLIFAIATPLLISGINRYNDIQTETILRDEADLLMSKFFLEIYTLKESEIKKLNWTGNSDSDGNYYFEYARQNLDSITKKTEIKSYILGFKNGQVYFKGVPYQFSNPSIQLSSPPTFSTIEKIGDNNYRVTLELYNSKKHKSATFVNEIQTINDKGDGS